MCVCGCWNARFPVTHDGQQITFQAARSDGVTMYTVSRSGNTRPVPVTAFDESAPVFSPGGGWLAYVSDESGRREVYVQPFPGPGAKWTISTDGGTEPARSSDGKELYYRRGEHFISVAISTGPTFQVGKAQTLFESRYETIEGARDYDVSGDGRSFVVVRSEEAAPPDQFNVVLNWFAEFRARR